MLLDDALGSSQRTADLRNLKPPAFKSGVHMHTQVYTEGIPRDTQTTEAGAATKRSVPGLVEAQHETLHVPSAQECHESQTFTQRTVEDGLERPTQKDKSCFVRSESMLRR